MKLTYKYVYNMILLKNGILVKFYKYYFKHYFFNNNFKIQINAKPKKMKINKEIKL